MYISNLNLRDDLQQTRHLYQSINRFQSATVACQEIEGTYEWWMMNEKLFVISEPNLFLMCTCLTIYHGWWIDDGWPLFIKPNYCWTGLDNQQKNTNIILILLLGCPGSFYLFWLSSATISWVFSDIFFDWWAASLKLLNQHLDSNESCDLWKMKKLHTENI